MAFSEADLKQLAKLLGKDEAVFIADYKKTEEVPLELTEGLQAFTPEELTTRDASKVTEGKKLGLTEGKTIGREIAVKDFKEAFGVTVDGKDLAKVVEVVKENLEKGDENLKAINKQLTAKLADKDTTIQQLESSSKQALLRAEIVSMLPKNRRGVDAGGLTDSEYVDAVLRTIQIESADGTTIVKRDGQPVLNDKTNLPKKVGEVITDYFTERKWTDEGGGAGAGEGGRGGSGKQRPAGSKPTSTSEAAKEFLAQGKKPEGAEFQQYVSALVKENKDFVLDTIEE